MAAHDLLRFHEAQDETVWGFTAALAEMRAGRKRGHWIWFVFPQLAGLGHSEDARLYGVRGRAEAAAYLRDGVLRSRLLAVAEAAASHLRGSNPVSLRVLMGSEIDVRKLISSMTLFRAVARDLGGEEEPRGPYEELARVAGEVLAAGAREGFPPCAFTETRLREEAGGGVPGDAAGGGAGALRVRRGAAADAERIAGFNGAMALETEAKRLDPVVALAGVRGLLARPALGFYLVAEAGEEVVGSLLVTPEWTDWRSGLFWWIQSVYVVPAWRRRGVYRRLHEAVRSLASAEADVRGLRLYVERENAGARRTYERLGMQETAYRLYEETLPPGP